MKMLFLSIRAKCAYLWRIGIIKRTTAFRWEMDRALGEYTKRRRSRTDDLCATLSRPSAAVLALRDARAPSVCRGGRVAVY